MTKTVTALVAALLVGVTAVHVDAQSAAAPKGVKTKGLVTSLGAFGGFGKVATDLLVSGSTVEIEPGGQTGRQRFLVPTFIYVIEGVLTTEYDPGPVAHGGTHYFSAGQSHMDSKQLWHNFKNGSNTPLKYLVVHIGYPGAKTIAQPEAE